MSEQPSSEALAEVDRVLRRLRGWLSTFEPTADGIDDEIDDLVVECDHALLMLERVQP